MCKKTHYAWTFCGLNGCNSLVKAPIQQEPCQTGMEKGFGKCVELKTEHKSDTPRELLEKARLTCEKCRGGVVYGKDELRCR